MRHLIRFVIARPVTARLVIFRLVIALLITLMGLLAPISHAQDATPTVVMPTVMPTVTPLATETPRPTRTARPTRSRAVSAVRRGDELVVSCGANALLVIEQTDERQVSITCPTLTPAPGQTMTPTLESSPMPQLAATTTATPTRTIPPTSALIPTVTPTATPSARGTVTQTPTAELTPETARAVAPGPVTTIVFADVQRYDFECVEQGALVVGQPIVDGMRVWCKLYPAASTPTPTATPMTDAPYYTGQPYTVYYLQPDEVVEIFCVDGVAQDEAVHNIEPRHVHRIYCFPLTRSSQ